MLKRLRERKNFSQTAVASYLNMTLAGYNGYEIGKSKPPYETLMKLADLYNVSTDFMLERKPAEIKTSGEFDYITEMLDNFRGLHPHQQQQVAEYVRLLKLDNTVHQQTEKKHSKKPRNTIPTIAAFGGGVREMDLQKLNELAAYKKSLENDKKK